jgi:uncharacterized protein YutE (UPF0331/DUF86 family)/predicted nucleotidyltransferase
VRLKRQYELVEYYCRELQNRLSSEADRFSTERLAQLVIQSLLDLAAMLAVREAGRKPETYRELALWLSRKLSLDDESTKFLVGLAGFRNILVHGYASIDESMEAAAFREIVEKLPSILDKLKSIVPDDPDPNIESSLHSVALKHGLKYVFLFGSRAREGFGRDYDIAVVFEKRPTSALTLGLLLVDLAEALGVHEELIDLVDLDTAPLSLVKTIIDEGKILYGDSEALDYLWQKYLEYLDANESAQHSRL